MGKLKKIIIGTILLGGLSWIYRLYGLNWTIISIVLIIIVYVIYKLLTRGKEEYVEGSDDGGYFSGLFTD